MNRHVDSIMLKPSELKLALADAIRSDVVPCVLGSPGIGKSDIIKQTVSALKMRLVDERASTMDLTDWRGVPDIDRKRGRTVWYPPNFLPTDEDDPTVVFFDEITQVKADCQPPLYQLLLDGKLGTVYRAPESTRFVCAGNLMDDGTFANKLGSALRDRMVFLYLKPDLDDWCRWAFDNGIAPVVIAFNRFKPEALNSFDKTQMVSPTARGWEFVSRIVQNSKSTGRTRDALIEGKIGHPYMVEFTAFERTFSLLPDTDSIIKNPGKAPLPPLNKPELVYAVANGLAMKSTPANFGQVMVYLNRLPEEYTMFAVKLAVRCDSKLQTVPAFTEWFIKNAEAMN